MIFKCVRVRRAHFIGIDAPNAHACDAHSSDAHISNPYASDAYRESSTDVIFQDTIFCIPLSTIFYFTKKND